MPHLPYHRKTPCRKEARGGRILPALFGCGVLSRSFSSESSRPQGQFLRKQAQGLKFVIQAGKLTAKDVLVVALFFLQLLDLHDPPLHGGRTAAAGLDEVVRPFLVTDDVLFDRQIKLLGHLVALLGIVDEVDAVRRQRGVVSVQAAELLEECLKHYHLIHCVPGHEIDMTVDIDLGGIHRAQILHADGLNLLAVGAGLVEIKKLFGLTAILHGVHIVVVGEVVIAKPLVSPVVMDIGQFFILIGIYINTTDKAQGLFGLIDNAKVIPNLTSDKIFCYILDLNDEIMRMIAEKQKVLGCESIIVGLSDTQNVSIEQWLCNIMNSKMVITDSFHGTVFSILFNKPFVFVGNEKRGNARIDSLFKLLDIKNTDSINWSFINKRLEEQRTLSISFLQKSLQS